MSATIFLARTIWAGTGEPTANGAIAVVDGTVIAAGKAADVRNSVPDIERSVDLGDVFLMPGMIDAHVHLHFPARGPGDVPMALSEPIEFTTLRAAFNAQVYLAAGITAVMDCGTRGNVAVALREAVDRGICAGPRIVASGAFISPTGGLADEHPSFVHADMGAGVTADTPDELRRAARAQIKAGVDNIKLGISGSALNPHSDPSALDMTEQDVAIVVDIAHRSGVTVAAHCQTREAALAAIRGGADTIHHGPGMDESCLGEIKSRRMYFVPTAMKTLALIEEGAGFGRPAAAISHLAARYERFEELLASSVRQGLANRMAAGSDAGNLPPAHGTAARELRIFKKAGMSPVEVLQSITRTAAAAIGRDDVGILEPGSRADFLAVDGDPLTDPAILEDRARLAAVFKGGVVVSRRGIMEPVLDTTAQLRGELWRARRVRRPDALAAGSESAWDGDTSST